MQALELICGEASAPGTTITALTANTGNSFTIRNAGPDSDIRLLQAWATVQAAGTFRIRSPRMHDNVQGFRTATVADNPDLLLPERFNQKLFSQDQLTVELSGSATAGDLEMAGLLVYYSDLPGVSGRFISPDDVASRGKNILTVVNTLSLGTGGDYSGEEALNADFDVLKANTDYAMVGYVVSAQCNAVRWRGADFGNLGIGGPGNQAKAHVTSNFFIRMSALANAPLVPVFNSANKDGILVDGHQDEDGTDVTVAAILVELGG